MSAIHLLPIGGANRDLAGSLPAPLRQTFRTGVEMREFDCDPEPFLDSARGQYNSTAILLHLKKHYGPLNEAAPVRVIALVPFDLYIPVLTYVFGEAEVGGNVAVVSYYRLAPERYGLSPDNSLLASRLVKEAVHELGHVYSLVHCSTHSCVMHSSTYVEQIDLKESSFCPICASELPRRAPSRA